MDLLVPRLIFPSSPAHTGDPPEGGYTSTSSHVPGRSRSKAPEPYGSEHVSDGDKPRPRSALRANRARAISPQGCREERCEALNRSTARDFSSPCTCQRVGSGSRVSRVGRCPPPANVNTAKEARLTERLGFLGGHGGRACSCGTGPGAPAGSRTSVGREICPASASRVRRKILGRPGDSGARRPSQQGSASGHPPRYPVLPPAARGKRCVAPMREDGTDTLGAPGACDPTRRDASRAERLAEGRRSAGGPDRRVPWCLDAKVERLAPGARLFYAAPAVGRGLARGGRRGRGPRGSEPGPSENLPAACALWISLSGGLGAHAAGAWGPLFTTRSGSRGARLGRPGIHGRPRTGERRTRDRRRRPARAALPAARARPTTPAGSARGEGHVRARSPRAAGRISEARGPSLPPLPPTAFAGESGGFLGEFFGSLLHPKRA
ncbi:hypothetical protein JHW43_009131 [Diplocarpon mali]|nr:hypothetical protein JHW43_009131 [Diplocarpon mali]